MATGEQFSNHCAKDWLRSLMILHRGHWNAARIFDRVNLLLGIIATVMAAISGATAFSKFGELVTSVWSQLVISLFGLMAAAIVAVQTFFRSSELASRHKQAAVKFGQLRRELEESFDLGLPANFDARKEFLTSFRERWKVVDDKSPSIPDRIYQKAKTETEKKLETPEWSNFFNKVQ